MASVMAYDFNEQFSKGQEQEERLDEWFSRWFYITTATREQQREGIDRIFEDDDRVLLVEYKADFRAHLTGNAYIETVSVGKYDENNEWQVSKRGWVYTSSANILVYLVVETGKVYMLDFFDVRERLPDWVRLNKYRSVTTRNNGYQGRGLLVPLSELAEISKSVGVIGE